MILLKTFMEKLPETCSKCQLCKSISPHSEPYCTGFNFWRVTDLNSKPENCPLVEFDETKIDDRYRHMGDSTILDTKINEKLHPCPYEGCEGACPYYVYFDDFGFYCYENECCAMEEGK